MNCKRCGIELTPDNKYKNRTNNLCKKCICDVQERKRKILSKTYRQDKKLKTPEELKNIKQKLTDNLYLDGGIDYLADVMMRGI